MKSKNAGCAWILIPWILLVAGALIFGEPRNIKLASFIGQTITFYWPLLGIIVSWFGSAGHMLFGMGDYDPTPGQEYMHLRRGRSMQLFFTLSAVLLGILLAYLAGENVTALNSIIVGIPLVGGSLIYIILYFQSCAVDRWTLAEQSQHSSTGFDWQEQDSNEQQAWVTGSPNKYR